MKSAKAIILALVLALLLFALTACMKSREPSSKMPKPSSEQTAEQEETTEPVSELDQASSNSRSQSNEEDATEPVPEYYQFLMDEKSAFVDVVRTRVEEYRSGTQPDNPNHHPPYPEDFPPASELPDIQDANDFAIRFTGNIDALGGIYVAVPIDGEHEIHLDISSMMITTSCFEVREIHGLKRYRRSNGKCRI